MRLLIEEHKYKSKVAEIREILQFKEIDSNEFQVKYVGYFYNSTLHDCVFCLPKVLLDENELVFGKYSPESLLDIDCFFEKGYMTSDERNFIYNLSFWIYRTLIVYNAKNPQNDNVKQRSYSKLSKSGQETNSTILDVILALVKFAEDNKNFLMFAIKDIHSGYNKINWVQTIARRQPLFQNGRPAYINPVNRKKLANYDEELFVIFFSILNYINKFYGLKTPINYRFDLIDECQFTTYLNGFGKQRLLQIKYKYFSDKAIELWNLCFKFFNMSSVINSNEQIEDYLICKTFSAIFESIIDELIGDITVPKRYKEQGDGKIVDHIYGYESVINDKNVYYIGDSKYYKMGHNVQTSSNSFYKQFTYAKNVIQYNLDVFLENKPDRIEGKDYLQYRDERTEGYNITPNFYISAELPPDFKADNDNLKHRGDRDLSKCQFPNRLFDRDTLWLSHYDINFLFVIALYIRNNDYAKDVFRNNIRKKFRDNIIRLLEKFYTFYIAVIKNGCDMQVAIDKNFRLLNGKVFCPYEDNNGILIIALEKDEKFQEENNRVINVLRSDFLLYKGFRLGQNFGRFLENIKKGSQEQVL